MQYEDYIKAIEEKFNQLQATCNLFRVQIHGAELWDIYIAAYRPEDNVRYRDAARTEYDCTLCQNFFRRYANIVGIDAQNQVQTMFEHENIAPESPMYPVAQALTKAIKASPVAGIFMETYEELNKLPYEHCSPTKETFKLGIAANKKLYTEKDAAAHKGGAKIEAGMVVEFRHFHLNLSVVWVDMSRESIGTIEARAKTQHQLLSKAMTMPKEAYALFIELIEQDSLMNSTQAIPNLRKLQALRENFGNLPQEQRNNFLWAQSQIIGGLSNFINSALGTSIQEYVQGDDLEKVCRAYNQRVDPANYMKAKKPISESQRRDAEKFFEENGYISALNRRHAALSDIDINEICHINNNPNAKAAPAKTASIFAQLPTKETLNLSSSKAKRDSFKSAEKVQISEFMANILPFSSRVEAFFEAKHENNLAALTTAADSEAKKMFLWDNHFSWTSIQNLAGKSLIKEAVKARGGLVEGALRASIMWAEDNPHDNSDLDLWASEPGGSKIGYNTPFRKDRTNTRSPMSGQLDVDIVQPNSHRNKDIVENIIWTDLKQMQNGTYKIWVHLYADRNISGCQAEIEFAGETYRYENKNSLFDKEKKWQLAEITLRDGQFSIQHLAQLASSEGVQKTVWGISTNEFIPVSLVCHSPNYWGSSNVGHKHYVFTLQGCKSDIPLRSFHCENLSHELAPHRKVAEVLSASLQIEPAEQQLAGLFFNATVRDSLIVKVSKDDTSRIYEIMF